jgi:predicted restriction endonuclease
VALTQEGFSALDEMVGDLDRVMQVARRLEQAYLRRILIPKASAKCDLCGREFLAEFLIAAHIKKRSACSNDERRDVAHIVMAACKFGCDELFERGYIAVEPNGNLLLSDALVLCSQASTYAYQYLKGRRFGRLLDGREHYFEWHRSNSFRIASSP